MPAWLLPALSSVLLVLAGTALFFFVVTRGALIVRATFGGSRHDAGHVYPIYSNMRLIRLIDFQPLIAAILLFQYDRLVDLITGGLRRASLHDKNVLITSCAFGNVIPRVIAASVESGARRVMLLDIIQNELTHAKSKLADFAGKMEFLEENASATKLADGSVDANIVFFLLHELPHALKGEVLREATRVIAPGGKLYLAEFHRPDPWVLRALSWTYFQVFEPFGLALWDRHDPLRYLETMGRFTCERQTVFFGNFQLIVATRNSAT